MQGVFSLVWGGSSLIGPALGGVLTDQLSWRWVFFVTVPFGLISCWILIRHVHEKIETRDVKPIDWAGAGLLAAGFDHPPAGRPEGERPIAGRP